VASTTPSTNGDVAVITKQLVGHVDNSAYPLVTIDIQATLTTPANATGPVPVIMPFGGGFGGVRARRSKRRSLVDGDLAFRQHSGGHTDGPNWPTFLTVAERYFTTPGARGTERR
jgi:hypothetical protein